MVIFNHRNSNWIRKKDSFQVIQINTGDTETINLLCRESFAVGYVPAKIVFPGICLEYIGQAAIEIVEMEQGIPCATIEFCLDSNGHRLRSLLEVEAENAAAG